MDTTTAVPRCALEPEPHQKKAVVRTDSKARVLVIDDDHAVADTLALVLKFSGYDAVAVYGGEEGLELARQSAYDHLVTDVMMEPINGIQVCLAMRVICPDCKVLLISGNERASHLLAEAQLAGHEFDILAKPVHPSVILDRLREDPPPRLAPSKP